MTKQQEILDFENKISYSNSDYIIDDSNAEAYNYLNNFPNWEVKLVNLVGSAKSGKTHLSKILEKKNNFYVISSVEDLKKKYEEILNYDRICINNLSIDEDVLFSIINNSIINKKFLVISSLIPLTQMEFKIEDLKSRIKQFFILNIKNPTDKLVYSILLKFFSDNQIKIKSELIDFIVKKINRSYEDIFLFSNKIINESLKQKKKIDFKLINSVIDSL
jgi:chromosomal replication initiation ATPase DnaA